LIETEISDIKVYIVLFSRKLLPTKSLFGDAFLPFFSFKINNVRFLPIRKTFESSNFRKRKLAVVQKWKLAVIRKWKVAVVRKWKLAVARK
jgi:hypothetical protein